MRVSRSRKKNEGRVLHAPEQALGAPVITTKHCVTRRSIIIICSQQPTHFEVNSADSTFVRGLWKSNSNKDVGFPPPPAAFHPAAAESPKSSTPKFDNLGKKISRAFSGRKKHDGEAKK